MHNRKSYNNKPSGAMLDRRKLLKTVSAASAVLMMGVPTAGLTQSAPPATDPGTEALSKEVADFEAARREGIFQLSPFAEASPYDGGEDLKEIPPLRSSKGRLDVDLT